MKDPAVKEAAERLVDAMLQSEEYKRFQEAREAAFRNPNTRALFAEYKRLQAQVQALAAAGKRDERLEEQLRCLGEALHFDEGASALLVAEYGMNALLAELYRMLAKAAGEDLHFLEE